MSSPSKLVVSTHTVACPSFSKTKTYISENLIKAAEKENRTQTKCKIVLSNVGVFYQHVLVGSMGINRSTENGGSLGQIMACNYFRNFNVIKWVQQFKSRLNSNIIAKQKAIICDFIVAVTVN